MTGQPGVTWAWTPPGPNQWCGCYGAHWWWWQGAVWHQVINFLSTTRVGTLIYVSFSAESHTWWPVQKRKKLPDREVLATLGHLHSDWSGLGGWFCLAIAGWDIWRGKSWWKKGRVEGRGREGRKKEGKNERERKGRSSSVGGLALVDYSVMLRKYLSVLSKFKSHFLWIFKDSGHKGHLSDLDFRVCFTLIYRDSILLPFLSTHQLHFSSTSSVRTDVKPNHQLFTQLASEWGPVVPWALQSS